MIDFKVAVSVAQASVNDLVKHAKNVRLEGALTSLDGALYEIALSYENDVDPEVCATTESNLATLARIMGSRRAQKLFLVDSQTGAFRGFKNHAGV